MKIFLTGMINIIDNPFFIEGCGFLVCGGRTLTYTQNGACPQGCGQRPYTKRAFYFENSIKIILKNNATESVLCGCGEDVPIKDLLR